MNKYLQKIYLNIFFLNLYSFDFILLCKKLFLLFCYNKIIYVPSECIINRSTLSKKYLLLKPASGSENYHEYIACIGIRSYFGIRILIWYWNCYKIWCHPIISINLELQH